MKPASLLKPLLGLLAALTVLLTPTWGQNAADPAPPPSAPPKRSAADLEKLVGPIALYPDPVIATMLPASVYPLEIVQAARFVADTNNLAKLDAQPWDENVKEVARIPTVIKKMNDDLAWTQELGEAFLADDKGIMDAIQAMRGKAQKAGTLQTTPQQVVVVTNMIIEKTVEQQVVVVTNTIVQIQPADPQVVYVPTYNPYTVYYPPPAYVYNPLAPLVTFGAAVAVGAIIANNCDWYGGGCYHGNNNININGDVNINRGNNNINTGNIGSGNRNGSGQKWQPDQNRLGKSGSPTAAAQSREARGYGSSSAASARPTAASGANAGNRSASANAAAARPATGAGTAANRPTTSGASAGNRPAGGSSYTGGNAGAAGNANRATPSSSAAARPSSGGNSSAFGNMNSGASTRQQSSRGSASRGGGGGGRGGGGRR